MPLPEASIAAVLRPSTERGRSRNWAWAILAALLAHGGVIAVALTSEGHRAFTPVKHAAPDRVVELFEPPAPETATPPPAPAPQPAPAARAEAKASAAPAPGPAAKPAPAAAAAVVAAPAEEVVDFDDFAIATGTAEKFAGGVTSSAGTNDVAVHTREVAADGVNGVATPGRRARSVRLSAREWSCDWPAGARALRIDEQDVTLRVVVREDGTVESGSLVDDPGDGFGAAALSCARRTRFEPALDAEGRAIRSTSPPIRVRFTR